ncbi:hypothetical protein T552_02574 [Pneumocystis carinii B80]|uniref:J domain-containing protein n=1 Tax=Pneumocystis carinii (strain B80) TaxID=1408658 RepID=A0A0W4ZFI3_PNEC8|nr:hypothetical protein T552_02574 [Pneumocystis carinii B80]KTW27082.1 hypothetical protein T552_02574 [Pneumocystis carinii B80]
MTSVDEIVKILENEDAEYAKDQEIERILNAFKLDAYSVLDLQPGVSTSNIQNAFRKKSLLIHPDKTKNPKAPDAFDRLKKAESELMDPKIRERLDTAFATARRMLIQERKWTLDHPELDTEAFQLDVREKTKSVLIDDELRRRKARQIQMAEEGREKKRLEDEAEERKRKKEYDKAWEENRENRINSWRKFQKVGPCKRKKQKQNVGG